MAFKQLGNITSPLQSPTSQCCMGKQSLFIVRTIRNTQVHSVGRIYSNSVRTSQETQYVSATKPNQSMLYEETVAVYCENIRNTQVHSVATLQSFRALK
jgi:hypothetical protein